MMYNEPRNDKDSKSVDVYEIIKILNQYSFATNRVFQEMDG